MPSQRKVSDPRNRMRQEVTTLEFVFLAKALLDIGLSLTLSFTHVFYITLTMFSVIFHMLDSLFVSGHNFSHLFILIFAQNITRST